MATSTILNPNRGVKYTVGDSISIYGICSGYVSGSSKDLAFTVHLPYQISTEVTGITLSRLKGAVRGVSGYVNGMNNDNDFLSLSGCTIREDIAHASGIINVVCNFDSELTNVTNNTPVTVNVSFGGTFTGS